jgi:hypothetical protein
MLNIDTDKANEISALKADVVEFALQIARLKADAVYYDASSGYMMRIGIFEVDSMVEIFRSRLDRAAMNILIAMSAPPRPVEE